MSNFIITDKKQRQKKDMTINKKLKKAYRDAKKLQYLVRTAWVGHSNKVKSMKLELHIICGQIDWYLHQVINCFAKDGHSRHTAYNWLK